jgi:MFS family permease
MGFSFWILALCQGIFTTGNVVLMAVSALAGLELAPWPSLATLPATAMVVGSALCTPFVARLQRRRGRGPGFKLGLLIGAAAFGACALAISLRSFALLCLGSALSGCLFASASLYRVAAAELVPQKLAERALSLLLVCGLSGAFFGPGLAEWSRSLFQASFSGAYAVLAALTLATLIPISFIHFPKPVAAMPGESLPKGRSLTQLASQPGFIAAVLGAALAFGVMNLLMTATPLAMRQHEHSFHHSAVVLEWHVIAMFAPGLFSGRLISRFGPLAMMLAGLILNLVCVGLALGGVGFMSFLSALILLGLGWNFLFSASSALLMRCYQPAEKTTAQAAMDFSTFAVLAISSLSSGILVNTLGWRAINLAALLPLAVLAAVLLWAWKKDLHLRKEA